jgi:hypothetical protein
MDSASKRSGVNSMPVHGEFQLERLDLERARERPLNHRRFARLIRMASAGVTSRRDRRVMEPATMRLPAI